MNALYHPIVALAANILEHVFIARRGMARLCAGLLAVLVVACPAWAQTPAPVPAAPAALGTPVGATTRINLFEVRGVPVDATAGNTTEAREQAFTEGRVAALRLVVERVASPEDVAKLPQLPTNQVIDMVQQFSIANERSSAVRYLADLTVRFDAEAVRRLLRNAGIPFTESVSRPLVLLPFYGSAGPWNTVNPWRDAFAKLPYPEGLVPLILPAGDAEDQRLTMEQISAKDSAALSALAARYNAGGVVIARAGSGVPGGEPVHVSITEVRGIAPAIETAANATATAEQTPEELLSLAAVATMRAVSDNWKRQSRLDVKSATQITALALLRDLGDWVKIRNGLRGMPSVDRVELQAMTRDRAQIALRYRGDLAQFATALAQQGVVGAQEGNVWMLSLPLPGAGAGPAAGLETP